MAHLLIAILHDESGHAGGSRKGYHVDMKKRSKTIIAVVLIALAIFGIKHSFNPEYRINNFINQNSEELVTIAEAYLNSDTTTKTYKGVEVEPVYRGTHDIIQFYYGGFGLAPSTTYYGFYYSPDDVPTPYQNVNCNLTALSDVEWEWSDGTDNGGRTKKVMKNWFYYEAWF